MKLAGIKHKNLVDWVQYLRCMGQAVCVYGFLLATLGFSPATYSQQATVGSKILVLFDTNALTPFKQSFANGLESYIAELPPGSPTLRISYEFLGLENLPFNDFPDVFRDTLIYKQQADPASVVISALSLANSLSTLASELYTGLPVIYTAPNPELENILINRNIQDAIALISSAGDAVRRTVNVIPELLPDIERLYVISGNATTELEFKDVAAAALDDVVADFEIIYLTGLPLDELLSVVAEIPQRSSILLLPAELDINGAVLQVNDIYPRVIELANVPVFTAWEFIYQEGAVGGNFTNSEASGRRAAELAVSLLLDRDIDINSRAPTFYRFDQRQLQRWGIGASLLPTGSAIDNQQVNFWQLYSGQIAVLLFIFASLLFFLFFLKRQAKDLGAQKTLLESVINSIPDAILIADTNAHIFACNKGAEEVFGLKQDELLAKHTGDLLDPAVANKALGIEGVDLLKESVEPQLLRYKKKNEGSFSGETIATKIISGSGEVLGHFALVRDVSKRLSLEEEHRQGQKMEALGNLVGGISHDFNNVLGVISGYTELSLANKESKPFAGSLQQILKATDRAKSLIGQIMAFSSDRSSDQKPINLDVLLDETMKMVQVAIPSNIEITVKKDDKAKVIMGSAIQLQQIILNLTTNAYQAMKSTGGAIGITLEQRELSKEMNLSHGVLRPGCYIALSISDNGSGMSEAVVSRAFEPYFTTKRQGEGSGMGLAIVYNLVKAHAAMLDVKTVVGEGTCITVYLEAAEGLDSSSNKDVKEPVRGNGERILLVDDEESLLEVTQLLLSRNGYVVTAFNNPVEALQAFKQNPQDFDLILSDQSMPNLTGTQMLEQVRLLDSDIPAIICSGYSDIIDRDNIEQLKIAAVLTKPYRLEEISRIIASLLVLGD